MRDGMHEGWRRPAAMSRVGGLWWASVVGAQVPLSSAAVRVRVTVRVVSVHVLKLVGPYTSINPKHDPQNLHAVVWGSRTTVCRLGRTALQWEAARAPVGCDGMCRPRGAAHPMRRCNVCTEQTWGSIGHGGHGGRRLWPSSLAMCCYQFVSSSTCMCAGEDRSRPA